LGDKNEEIYHVRRKSKSIIDRVVVTSDTLTGREALSLFVRYPRADLQRLDDPR
jgi:hypothetical protein